MNKNTRNVIGGIMLIAGAYFVYRYFRGGKKAPSKQIDLQDFSNPPQAPITANTFPLKKGSKGAKVLELQNAIMKINPNLLPKFGADGDFGSETELAVSRMLGKKTIDSQADIETIKKGKNTKARG
jgi:hypothetical protein